MHSSVIDQVSCLVVFDGLEMAKGSRAPALLLSITILNGHHLPVRRSDDPVRLCARDGKEIDTASGPTTIEVVKYLDRGAIGER
jgi:hypothetical protein